MVKKRLKHTPWSVTRHRKKYARPASYASHGGQAAKEANRGRSDRDHLKGGCGKYNTTSETRELWRAAGDRSRERNGRKIIAAALASPTKQNIRGVQKHIDGYRAAAIHMGINVEKTLDRLFGVDWRKIEAWTRKLNGAG